MAKKNGGSSTSEIFLMFVVIIIAGSIITGIGKVKDYFENKKIDDYYSNHKTERFDKIKLLLHDDFLASQWFAENKQYITESWEDDDFVSYTFTYGENKVLKVGYGNSSYSIYMDILDYLKQEYGEEHLFLSSVVIDIPDKELYTNADFLREQLTYFGGDMEISSENLETRFQDEEYEGEEHYLMGMQCDVITQMSFPDVTVYNGHTSFLCDPLNEEIIGRDLYDWSR